MVAEDPEVAGLADSFGGNRRCLIRVGQAIDLLRAQELVELIGNEAGQCEIEGLSSTYEGISIYLRCKAAREFETLSHAFIRVCIVPGAKPAN